MTEPTAPAAPQPPPARTYTSRDPAALARTVVAWLWIELALQAVMVVLAAVNLQFLSGFDGDQFVGSEDFLPGAELIDLVTAAVALVWVVAYLVTAFLSLKWIYRVSRNAHAMASGLSIRPPWAVGWFFVPIAWLWMPFRGMREAWQASVEPHAWRSVPVPSLLRWWWGLWLVSNAFGSASMRLVFRATRSAS